MSGSCMCLLVQFGHHNPRHGSGQKWAEIGCMAWQIAMAVVQLPWVQSDLLITLNTPLAINPASAAAEHAGDLMCILSFWEISR